MDELKRANELKMQNENEVFARKLGSKINRKLTSQEENNSYSDYLK
jgi:hypothetical protein